jgi:hypothetical protein
MVVQGELPEVGFFCVTVKTDVAFDNFDVKYTSSEPIKIE